MKIKQYDTVLLQSGLTACIVEILEPSSVYIADIDYPDSSTETETIYHDQIVKVLYGKESW